MCARANVGPAAVIDRRLARRTLGKKRVLVGWLVGGRLALAAGQSLSFVSVLTLLTSVCCSAAAGQHGKNPTATTTQKRRLLEISTRLLITAAFFFAIVVTPSEFT